MKQYTFREFLRDKFAKSYTGLDDDMVDCEADWFMDLDVEQVIEWAEDWRDHVVKVTPTLPPLSEVMSKFPTLDKRGHD